MVNLKEGTRRLALLLGAVGALFGAFVSYSELQSAIHQRADHQRFQQLANSRVVQEQCRKRVASMWFSLDQEQRKKALARMSPEKKTELQKYVAEFPSSGSMKGDPYASIAEPLPAPKEPRGQGKYSDADIAPPHGKYTDADVTRVDPHRAVKEPTDWQTVSPQPVKPRFNPNAPYSPESPSGSQVPIPEGAQIGGPIPTDSDTSTPNEDGIKRIHWSDGFEPESIETTDGQTLYSMPAPGLWSYVAVVALPLLGFIIPWGAVRAIGWVLAGFVAGPKVGQ
jgi:hypothetical protein